MKRIFFIITIFLSSYGIAVAQKFAYVDTQYILDNLPEFTEAQAQLDELSNQWQKEIEAKFAEVDKMYKDYQTQMVLLPDDMKKKKEQEIVDKEKEAKNLQKQRFGKDGDLFKKRQELVKPVQEKVYNAIQDLATTNNYVLVLDKSGALTILYANPKYDISDEVLDNLGAAQGTRKGKNQAGSTTNPNTSSPSTKQGNEPKQNPGGEINPRKK